MSDVTRATAVRMTAVKVDTVVNAAKREVAAMEETIEGRVKESVAMKVEAMVGMIEGKSMENVAMKVEAMVGESAVMIAEMIVRAVVIQEEEVERTTTTVPVGATQEVGMIAGMTMTAQVVATLVAAIEGMTMIDQAEETGEKTTVVMMNDHQVATVAPVADPMEAVLTKKCAARKPSAMMNALVVVAMAKRAVEDIMLVAETTITTTALQGVAEAVTEAILALMAASSLLVHPMVVAMAGLQVTTLVLHSTLSLVPETLATPTFSAWPLAC